MAKQNVEIYFKVDGIEEYITDLEQLDNVLKEVRTATDNVKTATKQLEEQDFDKLENRVDALDGSVKVLAGSLEIAAGALGALGIENEFFKSVEENAINIIALAEGAINVSEGYKLLAQSGKLAAIQQRILNVVTAANPYVLLATAIIAAGAALAAYTLKTRNDEKAQRKANEEKRKAIDLANKKAKAESDEFKNSAALRVISRSENRKELQSVIDLNQGYIDESETRVAAAERQIRDARSVAAVTEEAKRKQTNAINAALKVIEDENNKVKENREFVEAATERLQELNDKREKSKELTEAQTAAIEAQNLALEQQKQALADLFDEQANLEETLYRAGLTERELAFRDLEDEYYDRLNLANDNAELIAQVEAQYEADKLALRNQFRQEDLEAQKEFLQAYQDQETEFKTAAIAAEESFQDAKIGAIQAGFALAEALAGDNEKLADVIFGVQKALEIANIIIGARKNISTITSNAAEANANLAIQAATLLPRSLAGDPAAIAALASIGPATAAVNSAAAAGVAATKLNAAAGIAGIAASTIQRFRGGGSVGGGGGDNGPNPSAATAGGSINYSFGQQAGGTIQPGQSSNGAQDPLKVYVIATDVTNAQQANAQIQNLARL